MREREDDVSALLGAAAFVMVFALVLVSGIVGVGVWAVVELVNWVVAR